MKVHENKCRRLLRQRGFMGQRTVGFPTKEVFFRDDGKRRVMHAVLDYEEGTWKLNHVTNKGFRQVARGYVVAPANLERALEKYDVLP